MKNCFILIVFALIGHVCNATGSWARYSIGYPYQPKTVVDRFGNVFISGAYNDTFSLGPYKLTPPNASNSVFVAKYDKYGNVKWLRGLEHIGCLPYNGIGTDSLGNLYLATGMGIASSTLVVGGPTTTSISNPGQPHMLVLKFDSSGNLLWNTRTNGNYDEYPIGMMTDEGGNSYIVGNSQSSLMSFGTDTLRGNWGPSDQTVFVAKYDKNGNPLWGRGSTNSNRASAGGITRDRFGNITIVGTYDNQRIIFGYDTLGPLYSGDPFFVVHYDASGNLLWTRNGGGGGAPTGVATDADGNLFMAGYFARRFFTAGSDTVYNSKTIYPFTSEIYVVRYSSTGQEQWIRTGKGYGENKSNCIATDPAGNAYVTFVADSTTTFDTVNVQLPTGSKYPMGILKLSPAGNILETLMLPSGYLGWVTVSKDTDVYLAGTLMGKPSMFLSPDTVKVTAPKFGSLFLWKWKVGTPTTTAIRQVGLASSVVIFPNPTAGKVNFLVSGNNKGLIVATVTDATGRRILQRTFSGQNGKYSIECDALPDGLYYLSVASPGQSAVVKKFILKQQ